MSGQVASAQKPIDLKKQFTDFQNSFTSASSLYTAKSYDQSAAAIDRSYQQLRELMKSISNQRQRGAMKPYYERLLQANNMLAKQKIQVQDYPNWEDFYKQSSVDAKTAAATNAGDMADASKGVYVSQIAPLLQQKCGSCHISKSSGGLSMMSYDTMLKGAKGIPLITPGNAGASRMIEVIQDGDMPRGGQTVSPQELTLLQQWIQAGASTDGTDPTASLVSLVKAANASATMVDANTPANNAANLMDPPGSGKGNDANKISFARDIAPVLVENCKGCHVESRQVRGGLNMNSFTQMMNGSDSGQLLKPGDAMGSLLVQKLRGTAGNRMPAGRPALDEATIAKFEKWISAGARFDGGGIDQATTTVATAGWLANATPEEVKQRRMDTALADWKRVYGDREAFVTSGEAFVVLSDKSPTTAEHVSKIANEVSEELKKMARLSKGEELFPGGATIFVFDKRYDYSEFGKMAESRSLPNWWTGHWRRDGVNAYVAMLAGSSTDEELAESLKINLAALYMSSFGAVPKWFADGYGRYLYSLKTGRSDPQLAQWEQSAQRVLPTLKSAETFLKGEINEEDAAALGFVVVRSLNEGQNLRKFDVLLRRLQKEPNFDAIFASVFGPMPATIAYTLGLKPK